MVRIFRCSFCNKEIEPGTGMIYVKNNGTLLRFCSSKCRKNMLKLKRESRDFKWASGEAK
ncbi:MAG: 50S ribosomal protein L24e [Candidatus Methanomethylicia archaeon]|jgi:large subunit ribosomal protein L24e|uniref:Large ribosomal subunit protein eL24 n=1 Tax=Thermoproteota archaeon TaxID=2056631 RepID=A0A520KEV9_9CREN|nr:50S ribosomal protein L24e [Candidatus Methanomethylicia archaeon]MCQ5340318.1 50S ribosomal protein L24e [Candidatus Methanomethylicia archaeon]NHV45637.1 50S ribosomal protein L24e [Candidatus Verstraetearchaeota archaeon]RZN55430.1 MAG: 50S ribosomal protein L24e [Candidatus Verstraetearchaeota archaeon]TDA38431.1 MAG: 50S ribosomal protein L24e [Candidatus Verstraetearchaeota archaeon]